jgi:hypothetical protein
MIKICRRAEAKANKLTVHRSPGDVRDIPSIVVCCFVFGREDVFENKRRYKNHEEVGAELVFHSRKTVVEISFVIRLSRALPAILHLRSLSYQTTDLMCSRQVPRHPTCRHAAHGTQAQSARLDRCEESLSAGTICEVVVWEFFDIERPLCDQCIIRGEKVAQGRGLDAGVFTQRSKKAAFSFASVSADRSFTDSSGCEVRRTSRCESWRTALIV